MRFVCSRTEQGLLLRRGDCYSLESPSGSGANVAGIPRRGLNSLYVPRGLHPVM